MMTVPIFSINPAFHLPRPDRIPWKSLWPGSGSSAPTEQAPIRDVLEDYELSLVRPARKAGGAGRSHNWLVETGDGNKILKRYKAAVDRDQIRHEHSILTQLADRQFPAPRLNETMSGETLVEREDHRYALFNYLEGYFQFHQVLFIPNQTNVFLRTAGATLASLHQTLRDFTPVGNNPNGFVSIEGPRWRGLDWYQDLLKKSQEKFQDRSESRADGMHHQVFRRSSWIADRLVHLEETLNQAPLARVIIHGDYGPYNLLLKQGSPVVIIDYELARLDWRLTDLSYTIITFARNRLGFHLEKLGLFLQGYQKTWPIPTEELRYLPMVWEFLSLRRAVVCWYQSLDPDQGKSLIEARDRLAMVDWITEHRDDFSKVYAL